MTRDSQLLTHDASVRTPLTPRAHVVPARHAEHADTRACGPVCQPRAPPHLRMCIWRSLHAMMSSAPLWATAMSCTRYGRFQRCSSWPARTRPKGTHGTAAHAHSCRCSWWYAHVQSTHCCCTQLQHRNHDHFITLHIPPGEATLPAARAPFPPYCLRPPLAPYAQQ